MISFLIQGWSTLVCGWLADYGAADAWRMADQSGLYNQPFPQPDHDVRLCVFLDRTSIYRIITSSLLFFRDARVSEAENSLGLKKEVACIGLRRVQARQYRSIRSARRIIMFLLLPFFQLGTFRSLPLECYQAPRKKESFIIDRVFFHIADSQT
jgi:hypothetical protein